MAAGGGHVGRAAACRSTRPTAGSGATAQARFWGEGDEDDVDAAPDRDRRPGEPDDERAGRRRRRRERPERARARPSRSPSAGRSVLVLEAQDRLGGAVATEELTLPGFHHDVFSVRLPRRRGVAGVRAACRSSATGCAGSSPRSRWRIPSTTGARSRSCATSTRPRATLDALHPGDGAAWRELAAPYVEHYERAARDDAVRVPAGAGPGAAARRAQAQGTLDFVQILLSSARGPRRSGCSGATSARGWLYGSAMHGDVGPGQRGQRDLRRLPRRCSATSSAGPARRAARDG